MQAACGFKPSRMANGGRIQGPGTGTSDSIPATVPVGSYVMPTDSTRSINVSNGETALTPTQVHAVGTAALEAVRKVSHKPVKARGFKSKFADGGTVTDDDLTKQPTSYADQMGKVGGFIANGLGTVAKTAVGAPGYGLNALLNASNPSQPSPSGPLPTGVAPSAAGFGRGAVNPAAIDPNAALPGATPATIAPVTSTVAGAPGVTKTVGPDGVTYSNVPGDTGFAARGAPSAQNQAAAQALADRSARPPQEAAPVSAAPGTGLTVLPDTGGYGLRDKAALDARNAAVDTGGPLTRSGTQLAIAAANNATSRANTQAQVAEQRYGVDTGFQTAQQRLALDQQNAAYTNAHAAAQTGQAATATQQAQAILAARMQYAKALQSGDQKTIDAAESNLRGQEGRWERNYPEMYKTTALPATINPDGSRSPGGAIVTDARTGETRIIYGKDTQSPDASPAIAEGSISTVNGKKAKFIGGKWVPQ